MPGVRPHLPPGHARRPEGLDAGREKPSLDGPYADVRDAWRAYLAHDNHGRGVVLIGHSQGSILLTRLIAEEIDGKPAQTRLVAAYLAGDLGFSVPAGKDVGGTFKSIPLCRSAAQFGCALVWSTYQDGDASSPRFFGVNPGAGLVAACTNPAALAGGRAPWTASPTSPRSRRRTIRRGWRWRAS